MHPRSKLQPAALLFIATLVAALCSAPSMSHGYGMSGVGGKLGVTSPEDLNSTVMVGGHLEFEENATRLHLMPNLMYWKTEGISDVNPNFDVYYHFSPEGTVTPYLGGGVGLNVRNNEATDRSKTAVGANVIGGLRFPGATNHYFLEGRFTASDQSQVALLGGITFHTR